jgi:hypothetical protein
VGLGTRGALDAQVVDGLRPADGDEHDGGERQCGTGGEDGTPAEGRDELGGEQATQGCPQAVNGSVDADGHAAVVGVLAGDHGDGGEDAADTQAGDHAPQAQLGGGTGGRRQCQAQGVEEGGQADDVPLAEPQTGGTGPAHGEGLGR